ncbi:hypothetical protein PIB30_016238 [Stylosanthes scabra]|uniref:Uncharacterized protein n=1 Tax=Stylosanthes scabra TaxID=79078 RepID=A0ABU6X4U0_9FABA|nr:hypothetical protein [Stylosanthes scabra]
MDFIEEMTAMEETMTQKAAVERQHWTCDSDRSGNDENEQRQRWICNNEIGGDKSGYNERRGEAIVVKRRRKISDYKEGRRREKAATTRQWRGRKLRRQGDGERRVSWSLRRRQEEAATEGGRGDRRMCFDFGGFEG